MPMTSVFIFATLGPVIVTLLVLLLVGRNDGTDGGGLLWRTALAGTLTPVGLVVLSIPTSLFGGFTGGSPNITAQAVLFTVELAAVAVLAATTLALQWLRIRAGTTEATAPSVFVRVLGPVYLAVLALLWASALPAHLDAVDGFTSDGTPVGSLPYAGAAFAVAALCLAAALSAKRSARASVTSRRS
ncbi:hypothetical protein [Mycobacterium sp. NAZ190054]|uniref:hypothetical protein n=1 Tax=Mycobacterium sp. NAZ190054 TaxID=1747766 RepID=UPI000A6FF630|nr:hypothetical protein [Mycobacterium sp. NAZ190054]